MAVLNVRVEDRIRDALQERAEADGVSLSEFVRDLLRAAVVPVGELESGEHGDEPAPESLRFIDRKILSMLHRLLSQTASELGGQVDREYELSLAEALQNGYTGEYWREAAGFATELSKQETRLLIDILQMFRILTFSVRRHQEAGEELEPELIRTLRYRGFDFNDALEGQMASYVRYLVDDGRWSELKPFIDEHDGGNSHMEMLGTYSRMLTEYRRIVDARERRFGSDDYLLSLEELRRIAEAWVHPDHRGATRAAK